MYFPYFRGRQYELLALKELADKGLLSNSVIPVVEPVKLARKDGKIVIPYRMISTFDITLKAFSKANHKIAIIGNPKVGDLANSQATQELLDSYMLVDNVIPSIIINESASKRIDNLGSAGIGKGMLLAVFDNRDFLPVYKDKFCDTPPQYTLFSSEERKIRRVVRGNKVMFKDWFKKQAKNADYAITNDEPFSEDHLYFAEENYFGFGDYSIVGNVFDESGFAPTAVAIHIVYFQRRRNYGYITLYPIQILA